MSCGNAVKPIRNGWDGVPAGAVTASCANGFEPGTEAEMSTDTTVQAKRRSVIFTIYRRPNPKYQAVEKSQAQKPNRASVGVQSLGCSGPQTCQKHGLERRT